MPLEPDRIFYELGHLLNEMPDMNTEAWQTPEGQRWFGRVAILIREMGELPDYVSFNMAVENLHSIRDYPRHVQEITAILNRTLAQAELRATPAARAAFIPVGEVFAAFATVSRIVAEARSCVMFVDPFADANLLTEFAVLVPEGVAIRILADAAGGKPALPPAITRWVDQYGETRPLEARLAQPRTLHDRLIIIDDQVSWAVGQSFNSLATRAPTSIIRTDAETARLKIDAHRQIWNAATPVG